jgi:alpha-L-fucosidase
VLATFHSRLGYARSWPSPIPGTCATKRDFLGELITAAHAKNIHVILYMTNDAQWHDLNGHEWMDSAAFSKYAGHTVDLDSQDGFGEYSYDNFLDVMKSHPALDGFWIDNDNQYWLDHNLYQQIYQLHPNMTISNNNEDTPIMDMISNEQKTGMTPAYDMPQAYYTAAPRLTEADYKLPSSGAWWYDGSNSSVDYALNIGRYVANAGNTVLSLMAETAQVNGKFPSNQANFNNFMNTYLPPIWESISGTYGGGFMYGGMPGGAWNNGAYGYTTISKSNADNQYIHVITKPSGSTFKVRDGGYSVASVTNLRTGAAVSFSQGSGYLTLSGISSWDQYDTVFKVVMSGRSGITTGVSATASASASGHAAGNLVDGSYLNYWDSNKTTPVTITLDQGSAKNAAYLAVNQREDTITQTASSSARIKAYKILTSSNNSTWTTVKSGTLPNARGAQYIDIGASARYVRLEVDSTYASSKQLRIDELWLANAYAGGGTTPPPNTTTVQAEASGNTLSGAAAVASCSTCLGGAKVRFIGNNASNYETIPVSASAAGTQTLTVTGEVSGTRSFQVSVNGGAAQTVSLTGTDWATPVSGTVTITLAAGTNTIKLSNDTAYAPDLDQISIG